MLYPRQGLVTHRVHITVHHSGTLRFERVWRVLREVQQPICPILDAWTIRCEEVQVDCTALHPLLQQRIPPCVRAVLAAGCSWRSHEYTLPAQQHTSAPDSNPCGFCSHAGLENLLPKLVERPWFIHMCVRPCPRQPVDLAKMVNTLDTIVDTSDPIDLLLRQFNSIPGQ